MRWLASQLVPKRSLGTDSSEALLRNPNPSNNTVLRSGASQPCIPKQSLGTRLVWAVLVFALLAASTIRAQSPADPLAWPAATRECRPWAYNWWLGSAVDPENLARELKLYRDAGMGGIHIIPIYGARGAESRYIDYLSPKWFEMLRTAIEEAKKLDLGVDMTTGTGWCFGGPNISKELGGWKMQTKTIPLAAGAALSDRFDPNAVVALVAVSEDGKSIDLKSNLDTKGRVSWIAEGKPAKVFCITAAPGGNRVKRASPGGEGLMINPFSAEAMRVFLSRFTEAFGQYKGPLPRAMYHDSYEYQTAWSNDLLEQFAKRRGYRLESETPAFCGEGGDRAARVLCDFRETISDAMIEDVFPQWTQWCRERGIRTRNQAHGSPGNLLDLYALADVPETEMFGRGGRDPLRSGFDAKFGEGDRDPLVSKFASSAAHVAGRPLVSAETGTWLAEHFCETLEELKCLVDLLLASGVNHVVYHGTCYSPDDAPWPGWLFYASTQMNPRNAFWRDADVLNAYIARCQSVLQSGKPDNDVLLYWPIHDEWQSASGYVQPHTVHRRGWLVDRPIGETARTLWRLGYGFDYVSDRQLAGAKVGPNGRIVMPGGEYRAVVVPPSKFIPLETMQKFASIAKSGAAVIFEKEKPADVPGLADLERRRAEFKKIECPPAGELAPSLEKAGVPRETLVDHSGMIFVRRRHEEGRHYFVANQSTTSFDGFFYLATPLRSAVVLDPLTGRTAVAELKTKNGAVGIRLRLEPGHSVILRTFERRDVTGDVEKVLAPTGKPIELAGPWTLEFVKGGPELPKPRKLDKLQSWAHAGDADAERFGGTAVYRTTFDAPAGAGAWRLDLGRVCHSARVRLNGQEIGRLIMAPYRLDVPKLQPGKNSLEIEVTNLSANRIRDLDRRKVPWRVFHDANVVSIAYKPFDASNWPVLESGLLGPVTVSRQAP